MAIATDAIPVRDKNAWQMIQIIKHVFLLYKIRTPNNYSLFNKIKLAQHELNVDKNNYDSSGKKSNITKNRCAADISETEVNSVKYLV